MNKGKPTVEVISTALDYPAGLITTHHLDLCADIVKTPIKFVLPRVNTEHVRPFAAVAGPDNTKGNGVPGCYLMGSSDFMDLPPTPGVESKCYVGHSIRLGKRVKEHAKGLDKTTSAFLESLGKDAHVYLFIITDDIKSKLNGLPLKEFICVLEQYLFMRYFPSVNRSKVATAGVLHSPQALAKLREVNGEPVFIYEGNKNNPLVPLILRYIYPSAGFASTDLLGYERLGVRSIIRRGGWFRDRLFFSKSIVPNTMSDILLLEDLKSLVIDLQTIPTYGKPPVAVKVLDILTGTENVFPTKVARVKFLKCDRETVQKGRTNLYKKRYQITVLDD